MEFYVNGVLCHASKTINLFEIKEKFCSDADVMILNGYQTEENHPIQASDMITLLKKGVMPCEKELESMIMARHTPFVYKKAKKAKVAIAGLGGLGSHVAIMLARTGIGKLLLVDFDIVEPSNLNRQCFYIRHLGMDKTEAIREQIAEINPFIQIDCKKIKIQEKNVKDVFADYDIICEAFDKPEAKAELINTLLDQCPNIKIVAASGMAGYASANEIITKRNFSRLYLCGDTISEAGIGQGLMAPRVSVCAGHQANMILRLILEEEEP